MPKSITVTFPHQLGVAEAKRRITAQAAEVKAAYIDKIGSGDLVWSGDTGHVQVSAVGQTTTADIEVLPAEIRIEIQLPWLLAALSNKIQTLLNTNATKILQIEPPKKA